MSENGNDWSRGPWPPPGPRGPQDPRLAQDPRSPLPPGYEPVHHEPRPGQGRPDDSPWRRTQRLSRPEPGQWYPGQPAQASHGEDPRGEESYPPGQYPVQDQYAGGGYEDEYGAADRFVPGFGDDDDADDNDARSSRGKRRSQGPRPGGRGPGGPRRRRRFRWIAPLAALLVIVIPLAIGGVYVYNLYQAKYHPADYSGAGTSYLVVQVPSNATATSLAPELEKLGVVASTRAFILAAEHSTSPDGLLPGFYGIHKHMQATLAYAALLNPKDLVEIKVTIPEGWRVSQTVGWLAAHSGISLAAYDKVLKDPASLKLPASANGNPEGYLFPATYEIVPHETALGVLSAMVQRYDQEAATINLSTAAKQVHLSAGQVITMASLVQAEGGRLSDYPKIARVIYNRLAQNMPLQLDSTVLFGLNSYGIIASDQDLNSTSPYNTYKYKGLTPGPIDSPGDAAIQAVLHPTSANWLYFVTVNPKTGETLYTSSPAQFQQFRNELEKNLGQG